MVKSEKQRLYLERINSNQKGENNRNWKGGYMINKRGYKMIKQENHPRANKDNYVFEHIIIIEKHLGRKLRYFGKGNPNNEIVHHKDEDITNNKLNNLQVISPSEHGSIHRQKYLEKKGRLTEEEKKKRHRISNRAYYKEHREQKLDACKKRYQKNRHKLLKKYRENSKKYYKRNKELILIKQKEKRCKKRLMRRNTLGLGGLTPSEAII